MNVVEARELQAGDGVKAPGAPAYSTIRSLGKGRDGEVIARLDWGTLAYEPAEKVETGHNCPACGGTKDASYIKDGKWHVARCEVCNG